MRKRTKRKHWPLLTDSVAYAIAGAQVTPKELLDRVLLHELCSLDAMTRGKGSEQEWLDLNAVLLLCRHLAEKNNVGAEALPACVHMQAALQQASDRWQKTGRMGLSGPGIQAVRNVIEYHHLQRQAISRAAYERAIDAVTRQVKAMPVARVAVEA